MRNITHSCCLLLVAALATSSIAEEGLVSEADAKFFENEVRPLLADHCIKCHGREKQEGGLRLDTRQGMIDGGDSGSALEPGDVDGSQIIAAIRYEDYEMPPSGQLSKEKIQIIQEWVARGAPWPSHSGDGGMELRSVSGITDEDRSYWAFKPLAEWEPPALSKPELSARLRSPIDSFVLARLEQQGLQLAPQADRRTLLRRAFFGLLGVPPSEEEARRFFSDDHPDAYANLIDRLLDDPRYGEKWARHWLDLVRYAESDGFNQDAERPTAYLYRDWVIRVLNEDMPYDQFVLQQLAGDEIDPSDPQLLTATGFLRHWIYEYNQRDVRTQWSNILNDLTDVTGEVFFGLGMGCARCHDHKFDPILRRDYYRLQATFASFIPKDDKPYATEEELAQYHQELASWESEAGRLLQEIKALEQPKRQQVRNQALNKFPLDVRPILRKPAAERDGYEHQIADLAERQVLVEYAKLDFAKVLRGEDKERWGALQAEMKELDAGKPQVPVKIMAAGEVPTAPPPTFIPPRLADSDPVPPESFEVFGSESLCGEFESEFDPDSASPAKRTSGRRTALARWINSPDNPLPHRVIVNRIWQYHFGSGIVRNTSDFGRLGVPPTHPQLLDWLAIWFLDHGRSLKELHRLIMTSSVYMQASQRTASDTALGDRIDSENYLLWHYPARRLDAEQIRDAMLVASGSLQAQSGGPSSEHDSYRRSVYTKIKRNKHHPFLVTFDAPDGSSSVGRRNVTTTPNQALLLTNASWPLKLAGEMAGRLIEAAPRPGEHVRMAYLRCLQREPTAEEQQQALGFLRSYLPDERELDRFAAGSADEEAGEAAAEASQTIEPADCLEDESYRAALTDLCHVLFNSSEFLYLE